MMDWDVGWGAGGWLAMSVMMVAFWGGIIALVVWAVRSATPRAAGPFVDPARRAEDVRAERFARGEIDEEEFTQRRALLRPG